MTFEQLTHRWLVSSRGAFLHRGGVLAETSRVRYHRRRPS